jgi:hypothetical protein
VDGLARDPLHGPGPPRAFEQYWHFLCKSLCYGAFVLVHGVVNPQKWRFPARTDNPALVFHALIGNDVCNGHPGTGSMTTPTVFGAAVNRTLDYLDARLPAGSA